MQSLIVIGALAFKPPSAHHELPERLLSFSIFQLAERRAGEGGGQGCDSRLFAERSELERTGAPVPQSAFERAIPRESPAPGRRGAGGTRGLRRNGSFPRAFEHLPSPGGSRLDAPVAAPRSGLSLLAPSRSGRHEAVLLCLVNPRRKAETAAESTPLTLTRKLCLDGSLVSTKVARPKTSRRETRRPACHVCQLKRKARQPVRCLRRSLLIGCPQVDEIVGETAGFSASYT